MNKEILEHALKRAYQLGQTYWQQADSDSYSQNKKSDETHAIFRLLVSDTLAALTAAQPKQLSATDNGHCPRLTEQLEASRERVNKFVIEQPEQPAERSFAKLYKDNAQGIEIERLKMRIEELEAQVLAHDAAIAARGAT